MAPLETDDVMAAAATAVAVAGVLEVEAAEVLAAAERTAEEAEVREEEATLEAWTRVARVEAAEVVGEVEEVATALIWWAEEANALGTMLEAAVDLATAFLVEAEALALVVVLVVDLCLMVVVDLGLGLIVVVVLALTVVFLVVVVFLVEVFLFEVFLVETFLLDDTAFLVELVECTFFELLDDAFTPPLAAALIVNSGDWFPVEPSVKR